MNAVFSSRSTGDGGISPVSAPGICVTANCSAIDGLPPYSERAAAAHEPPAARDKSPTPRNDGLEEGLDRLAMESSICHVPMGVNASRPGRDRWCAPRDPTVHEGLRRM